jgi:hypothetical protein
MANDLNLCGTAYEKFLAKLPSTDRRKKGAKKDGYIIINNTRM